MTAKEALEIISKITLCHLDYDDDEDMDGEWVYDAIEVDDGTIEDNYPAEIKQIETALNRLEELESQDQVFIFSGRMGGKQNLIVKKFQAFDKLEKVLKIIKKIIRYKHFYWFCKVFITQNLDYNYFKFIMEIRGEKKFLTKSEFNLLKEYLK